MLDHFFPFLILGPRLHGIHGEGPGMIFSSLQEAEPNQVLLQQANWPNEETNQRIFNGEDITTSGAAYLADMGVSQKNALFQEPKFVDVCVCACIIVSCVFQFVSMRLT